MNRQVEIKAEQIARMIVAGMRATRIAEQMNLSYGGLQRILKCPEYMEIEARVRKENVGKMDATLDRRAMMRNQLEDAVPDALKVLVEQVKTKRDLRAALEVLDRDPQGTFSKTRRVELQGPPADVPKPILEHAVNESELARDVLIRVPQPKVAEA